MLGIYKYYCDCYYGDISGIFVADSDDVKAAIGHGLYLGEVLGKHSQVEIELCEEDFTLVTEDQDIVRIFEDLNMSSGYDVILLYNETLDHQV